MNNYLIISEYIKKIILNNTESSESIKKLVQRSDFLSNIKKIDNLFFHSLLSSIDEGNFEQSIKEIQKIHKINNGKYNDFNIWSASKTFLQTNSPELVEKHENLNKIVGFADNGNGIYKSFLGKNNLIKYLEEEFRKPTKESGIPDNISTNDIIQATKEIDSKGIPPNRQSSTYDVIFNNKSYPPKLLISIANKFANGEELDHNKFSGGIGTRAFNLLEENGFTIIKKPKTLFLKTKYKFNYVEFESYIETVRTILSQLEIYSNDPRLVLSVGQNSLHLIMGSRYCLNIEKKNSKIRFMVISDKKINDSSQHFGGKSPQPFFSYLDNLNLSNDKLDNVIKAIRNEKDRFSKSNFKKHHDANFTQFIYSSPQLKHLYLTDDLDKLPNPLSLSNLSDSLIDSGLSIPEETVNRFTASLMTKPFLILSGLSGSGKTKLAQAFSMWISESEDQYCIVPVGADWTNRDPILGYVNALDDEKYVYPENGALKLMQRANEDETRPYFLILDEMNLSHVERYFADFLSVMESKDKFKLHEGDKIEQPPKALGWPENLFVIGTVNIDETTYMFSPKVLDRANVIEFRVRETDMKDFLTQSHELDMNQLKHKGGDQAADFLARASEGTSVDLTKENQEDLMNFFKELSKLGAEFGYRTASEITRFLDRIAKLQDSTEITDDHLDYAIIQKLLPKLHGSRNKLWKVLEVLGKNCLEDPKTEKKIFSKEISEEDIRFRLSYEKLARMHKNAIDNGFASFAEA